MRYPSYISYLTGKPAPDNERDPETTAETDVFVGIDSERFVSKPGRDATGRVSARLADAAHELHSADELARAISAGRAFLPSCHKGKRSPENWTAQQIFCIDVDNDAETLRACGRALPYFKAVGRAFCYGLPLLISYLSFSATESADRYRLIFSLERPTSDRGRAERFGAALLAAYPEADRSSVQLNRLFFGTDKEVRLWEVPAARSIAL